MEIIIIIIKIFEYFFKIGNGERRKLSKSAPPIHTLEGKHSEPWHNILHALFDTIMTPPQYEELVILCGDVIICMKAY